MEPGWAGAVGRAAGAEGRGPCFAWLAGPGGAADAVVTPTLSPISPAARIFRVRFMVGTSRCNGSGRVVPVGPVPWIVVRSGPVVPRHREIAVRAKKRPKML